jgi:uncharacterized integral membrane protein
MATPDIPPEQDPVRPVHPVETTPEQETGPVTETRGAETARKAHRAGLYALSFVILAVLVYLVALIAMNTARVSVSWVFGTSRVSLVWLVVFAAILGWLLGLLMSILFRRRTRRAHDLQSRPRGDSSSGNTRRQ